MPFVFEDEEPQEPEVSQTSRFVFEDEQKETPQVEEKKPSVIKDVGKQAGIGFSRGVAGTYGNLMDLLRLQSKDPLTPGDQLEVDQKFDILTKFRDPDYKPTFKDIFTLTDFSDVDPRAARLPSGKDITEIYQMMGVNTDPETMAGRYSSRISELAGAGTSFGSPHFLGSSAAGTVGQTLEEVGAPPWAQVLAEIGTFIGVGVGQNAFGKSGASLENPKIQDRIKKLKELGYSDEAIQTAVDAAKDSGILKDVKYGEQLQKELIADDLPRISRDTQKSYLERASKYPDIEPRDVGVRPQSLEGEATSLEGRIKEMIPKEVKENPPSQVIKELDKPAENLYNKVSDKIFPKEVKSDPQISRAAQSYIKESHELGRNNIKNLYKEASQAYENYSDVYPKLAEHIKNKITQLEQTLEMSPGERKAYQVYRNLYNKLQKDGSLQEYNVSKLLKTSDSIGATLDYTTTEPDAINILKELPEIINESAKESLSRQGADISKIQDADAAYRTWSNKFLNDEIEPFLQSRENYPEKLYKTMFKPEVHRSVIEAIDDTAKKAEISNYMSKEIVPYELRDFIKNVEEVGSQAYEREINNLKEYIDPKLVDKADKYLKQEFKDVQKDKLLKKEALAKQEKVEIPAKKAIRETQRKPIKDTAFSKQIESIAKWAKMKPEDLSKKMSSVDGIKELEKTIVNRKNGKAIMDSLKKQKIRDIFEPKIGKKLTGTEITDILSDRKNYELLEELLGKNETSLALDVASKLKDSEYNRSNISKALKSISKSKLGRGAKYFALFNALKGTKESNNKN